MGLACVVLCCAGCQAPQRGANYPAGALQVRYEAAGHPSSCLVAAVVMAANYLLDDHRYSEPAVRQTLSRLKLDEKRVGDLKHYLVGEGLHLVTLVGTIDGKPPISLRYWLLQRGYPVICVINRHSDDPAFNHAVVVIGISPSGPAESADTVYYLDPSSARMLHQEPTSAFEALWARGGHAMMVVVAPRQPG